MTDHAAISEGFSTIVEISYGSFSDIIKRFEMDYVGIFIFLHPLFFIILLNFFGSKNFACSEKRLSLKIILKLLTPVAFVINPRICFKPVRNCILFQIANSSIKKSITLPSNKEPPSNGKTENHVTP